MRHRGGCCQFCAGIPGTGGTCQTGTLLPAGASTCPDVSIDSFKVVSFDQAELDRQPTRMEISSVVYDSGLFMVCAVLLVVVLVTAVSYHQAVCGR